MYLVFLNKIHTFYNITFPKIGMFIYLFIVVHSYETATPWTTSELTDIMQGSCIKLIMISRSFMGIKIYKSISCSPYEREVESVCIVT
jgi:hypothetical protein